MRSSEDRFWAKVDRQGLDECWPWTGSLVTGNRYGRFWLDGKIVTAHRMAFTFAVGPIPRGLHVLHSCDNPPCCNPAHLSVGTNAENTRQRDERGRRTPPRGESHGRAKLTQAQVDAICARYAAGGISHRQLAREYGVHPSHVGRLINGSRFLAAQEAAA